MKAKEIGKKFMGNAMLFELSIIALIVLIWTITFHFVEKLSIFHSFYFVMTTMATIGFGDITPKTDLGRLLVIFYAFLWVPLFISISWLRLESRFNKRIKWYVTKVYKEVHVAEAELKQIEAKINKELDDVIEDAEDTEEKIEDASKEIKSTKEKMDKMEKEIKKDQISRWKKILLRK